MIRRLRMAREAFNLSFNDSSFSDPWRRAIEAFLKPDEFIQKLIRIRQDIDSELNTPD